MKTSIDKPAKRHWKEVIPHRDQVLLEDWLQQIQPYVISGQVEWASLPDMYDVFVVWENSQ